MENNNLVLKFDISSLPVLKNIASETRMDILTMIMGKPMNIVEIAQNLDLSVAITSRHVSMLESAGLVKVNEIKGIHGTKKMCSMAYDRITIDFSHIRLNDSNAVKLSRKIGDYDSFRISPKCGMHRKGQIIGVENDLRYFNIPDRGNADKVWFQNGFIQYDFKLASPQLDEISFRWYMVVKSTLEKNTGKCEAKITVNNMQVAAVGRTDKQILSGDKMPADIRFVRYDLIIDNSGCYLNGEKCSALTLFELLAGNQLSFKIAVDGSSENGTLVCLGSHSQKEETNNITLKLLSKESAL